MGINIDQIPEDQLLTVLGDGDWCLSLPLEAPDLVVSRELRQQIVADACSCFVRWVIRGTYVEIVHDDDPPWDCSGKAKKFNADPLILLTHHISLDTWLTNEYTGQSWATHMSGMGLSWETYEDELEDEIEKVIIDLMKAHLSKLYNYPEDYDIWDSPFWDEFMSAVELGLEQALRLETVCRSSNHP